MIFKILTFFFLFFDVPKVKCGEILLRVKNITDYKGSVHIAIYNEKNKFPKNEGKLIGLKKNILLVSKEGIRIKNILAGEYAVAIYHDENDNNKFDTFLSMPIEKYGFSKNAKVFFGPPDFEDASFYVKEYETKEIEIKLR